VKTNAKATCYLLILLTGGNQQRDFQFTWCQQVQQIAALICLNFEYGIALSGQFEAAYTGVGFLVAGHDDTRSTIENEASKYIL